MSIQRLPGNVAAQIKSSTTVASLNDTALGLLRNALDAGSSRVTILVDYVRGGCVVEDDGLGISPTEFLPDGGLGKLYYTSKYPLSMNVHGRRGTFLASAAALSLLTIVSRRGRGGESTLTIHNGKALRRHASASEAEQPGAASQGTRVTVHDLFGCMPVRARLRPSPESSAWSRDWNNLVRAIVALLLAWKTDVHVSVEDKVLGKKRTLRATASQGLEHVQDDTSQTPRLLMQAGLCEVTNPSSWVRIEASSPGVRISGTVCLEPVASKRTQFIHIGIEPLSEAHQADAVYDEINKVFAESNFGAVSLRKTSNHWDIRGPIDKFVREQRAPKGVDRWPMFCLGIYLEDAVDVDDVLDDKRQHLAKITALLKMMFVEFLKRHGFHDTMTTLYGLDYGQDVAPESPTKKQRTTYSDAAQRTTRRCQGLPERSKPASSSLFSSWPQTKTARPEKAKLTGLTCDVAAQTDTIQPGHVEDTSRFFVSADLALEDETKGEGRNDESDCGAHGGMEDWDSSTLTSGKLKISRSSLEKATVVGQVDRKFILIRAPPDEEMSGQTDEKPSGPLLILIDQHAADERCRVESLLGAYFVATPDIDDANTTILERALQFELNASERPILERARVYFQHWGVLFDVLPQQDEADASTTLLRVRGLPASIAERCKQEPRLVVDIIRKEIWSRNEGALSMPRHSAAEPWPARLQGCPRGVLDLVNSRACRSAVKFNDPLTDKECTDLFHRLLRCAFPFQCAHGRPSMVPLLHLAPEEEEWA